MATILTSRGNFSLLETRVETFKKKNVKGISFEQQILNFVQSSEFQHLCMFDPLVKNNCLMQITVEEGLNCYQYGNEWEVEGLQIKINSEDGLRCFKSKEIVTKREMAENRILCAMTFLVQGSFESWRAIPLLGNDDQLLYPKICRAFNTLAARKELKLISDPVWTSGTIRQKGVELLDSGALAVKTLSRRKAVKYMLCLPDNGKILVNVDPKDVDLKEVDSRYGCYFKTKFNHFRFGDKKSLEWRK